MNTRNIPLQLIYLLIFSVNSGAAPVEKPRHLELTSKIKFNGISDPIEFEVPPNTRSLTLVVEGNRNALYSLASLKTSDGREQVGLMQSKSLSKKLESRYYDEQISQGPGNLHQSIRMGTFSLIYPNRPQQKLPQGRTTIRVASDVFAGELKISVFMPENDGANSLHVNIIRISSKNNSKLDTSFFGDVENILKQAGISLTIENVFTTTSGTYNTIKEAHEPQEPPYSKAAELAKKIGQVFKTKALNIYFLDSLPNSVNGFSLGTPGPPNSSSYYYGIFVTVNQSQKELARVTAHEICHFLGLSHIQSYGLTGRKFQDPLDDTEPYRGNLMDGGLMISPHQKFVLSKSPLLTVK